MGETQAFRIGASNREYMVVRPRRRDRPGATDRWDGDWVDATVELAAGGFRGEFDAQLRAEDFVHFRDELRPLYDELGGIARFDTMEGWLSIQVQGDGRGHFHAECIAVDQPGVGNRLTFGIDFDQTELPRILRGLDEICEAIEVVGEP